MAQKLTQMAQNYPKWPKNDARIYALFPQFFFTEKAVPQTFSLLECMILFLSQIVILILVIIKLCLLVNGSSVLA
jgi:hypothetical protein